MSYNTVSTEIDFDNCRTLGSSIPNSISSPKSHTRPTMSAAVGHNDAKNNFLQNEYLGTIISILPNVAYLKDPINQEYLFVNESFKQLFNNSSLNTADSIHQTILGFELEAIETNEVVSNKKISPVINAEGSLTEYMLNFHPISVESSDRKYVLCYGYDVTKSISSSALYTLYKNTYDNEKEALQRFCAAIQLDEHLDGHLSPREFECLLMLAKGLSAKEMARVLEISNRTVENHLTNIKMKFSVNSNIELLSIFLSCYRQHN